MCGFKQMVIDDFDWSLTTLGTPTAGTGPEKDFGSRSGQGKIKLTLNRSDRSNQYEKYRSDSKHLVMQDLVCVIIDWYNFTGEYWYIEASEQDDGDVAFLGFTEITIKPEDGPHCLTFGYHMYGEDVNQLKVVRSEADGQETTLLDERGWSQRYFPLMTLRILLKFYNFHLEPSPVGY